MTEDRSQKKDNEMKCKIAIKNLNYFVILTSFLILSLSCGGDDSDSWKEWRVEKDGDLLTIAYGSGGDFPHYGVIDLNSSFIRMNYGYGSNWGPSILLLPSFWSQGILYQGTSVTTDWQIDGKDLIVYVNGIISQLDVNIVIRFNPPANERFSALVALTVNGDVPLDNKPAEAFKLVTIASMRTATDYWDSHIAFAEDIQVDIPVEGWLFTPPVAGRRFGFIGGSSSWKEKTPTIDIQLSQNADITGWVTYSEDPNDDNVGLWGASDHIVRSYSYTMTAKP